jgi:DnaJ-class molecular chaperone
MPDKKKVYELEPCATCEGTGSPARRFQVVGSDRRIVVFLRCEDCNGEGEVEVA